LTAALGLGEFEPNTNSSVGIGIDNPDTAALECLLDSKQCRHVSHYEAVLTFNSPDGCNSNSSGSRKVILTPA